MGFLEGIFGCINNPCEENHLPHYSTWDSSSNFTCHEIKSYPCDSCEDKKVFENLTDCQVIVDHKDDELTCENGLELNTVVKISSRRNCGRGRVWSKYRGRCVRTFING